VQAVYRYTVLLSVILDTPGRELSGKAGTCTRGVRACTPQHAMLSHICSTPQGRGVRNADSASAAASARSTAFAERTQACPFGQLSHTLGGQTWHVEHQKNVLLLSASRGPMPNTMAADKPLVLHGVRS
jgi:hypothetical protein